MNDYVTYLYDVQIKKRIKHQMDSSRWNTHALGMLMIVCSLAMLASATAATQ